MFRPQPFKFDLCRLLSLYQHSLSIRYRSVSASFTATFHSISFVLNFSIDTIIFSAASDACHVHVDSQYKASNRFANVIVRMEDFSFQQRVQP